MPDEELQLSREDWRKDRSLVMSDLRRVSDSLDKLTLTVGGELTNMKVEVATLKTKVAIYAAAISTVTTLILGAIIKYITSQ